MSSLFLPDSCDVTQSSYADRYSATDKPLVAQRLNEFLEFDGTGRFVTVFRKLMNQLYPIHSLTQYLRFIVLLTSKSILGKQVYQIQKDSYKMGEVHSLYSPSAVSAQVASQQLRDVLRIGVFRKHNFFLQYHGIQSVGKCQNNIKIALAN